MVDLEKLLAPVNEGSPAGEDRTYAGVPELEEKAHTVPEQIIETADGRRSIPAVEPNWRALVEESVEFFTTSKDLRVGVILTLALVRTEGIRGLHDGLQLLNGLVDRYWDTLYPRLDPEDHNDPTERLNILNNLSSVSEPYFFLLRIAQAEVARSKSLGRLTLEGILAAEGRIPAPSDPSQPTLTRPQVQAICRDSDPELVQANHAAAVGGIAAVDRLSELLTAKVGAARATSLTEIKKSFTVVRDTLAAVTQGGGDVIPPAEEETSGGGAGLAGATGTGRSGPSFSGQIRSRDDVARALAQICDYYRQAEPASPVPYLLHAAERLVRADYMQIVGEVTPDAHGWLKQMAERQGVLPPEGGS